MVSFTDVASLNLDCIVTAQKLNKLLSKGVMGYVLQIKLATENTKPEAINDEAVAHILEQYSEVFEAPTGLHLKRDCSHSIPLKPGSNPPNIRPYGMAKFQKDEIEKLIKQILSEGIIRPSESPYSSPSLLARKKKRWLLEVLSGLQTTE